MDVKSLAKSKRAHSQHHSKRHHGSHQSQKHKDPSSDGANDAGTAKKLLSKQVKEKAPRSQDSPALPSNWDRYDDEGSDSASERVSLDRASKISDVVLPKSKGADYGHLVAEAQSQANTSLDCFPSVDDVLAGEFNGGLRGMLAVRGEGILSWIGNDNFVVEDKTSGTHEASFLSLNLHALAENLAKVDLSKRLFIESDLLPHELCAEGSVASDSEESDKLRTREDIELANRMSEELSLDDLATDDKIADRFTSSGSCGGNQAASTFTLSDDVPVPVNYVETECGQGSSSGQDKKVLDPGSEDDLATEEPKKKLSTFEPASAEKELDMLLDSVSEIKILDSSGITSSTPLPVSPEVTSVNFPRISNKEPESSKTVSITASLDDALDDLLEETANVMNPNALLLRPEEKSVFHGTQSSSPHSRTKSKVLDEFDSWFDTI